MKYFARLMLVGCLVASGGCQAFRFDGPRRSLLDVLEPARDDRTAERPAPNEPIEEGDESNDEVYKRLFDSRKALDEIDPNEYGDLRRILERTPPSLQPLVVQEIVLHARKEKIGEHHTKSALAKVDSAKVIRPLREPAEESVMDPPAHRKPSPRQDHQPTDERRVVERAAYLRADEPERTPDSEPRRISDRWEIELAETIDALESELQDNGEGEHDRSLIEIYLRLLQLIAGDADAAVEAVPKLGPVQQEYWKNQIHSLSVLLDQKNNPLPDRRAALALGSLRRAVDQLSSTSALEVRNVAFCYAVDSYGQYKEFAKYQFKPNDQVLLYAEIDNFAAEPTNRGQYETALSGSYQIYDPQGNKVAERNFPVEGEVCRNRRRDFFIPYRIYIPKVNPGRYNLQLTMRDDKGEKTGQSALIEFTVTE